MTSRRFAVTFFGTSIMEHLEAHSAELERPYSLPDVGDTVVIDGHRRRGWIHLVYLRLQTAFPAVRLDVDNRGLGGATSRDVLDVVRRTIRAQPAGPDLAVLGVGINDVWRCFQGRPELAVHADEFRANYAELVAQLSAWARRVLCVSETPFGWDDVLDAAAMNRQLARYNEDAAAVARRHGIEVVDLWAPVTSAARQLDPDLSPWTDGAHLSELGDTIVAREVERAVSALVAAAADGTSQSGS